MNFSGKRENFQKQLKNMDSRKRGLGGGRNEDEGEDEGEEAESKKKCELK